MRGSVTTRTLPGRPRLRMIACTAAMVAALAPALVAQQGRGPGGGPGGTGHAADRQLIRLLVEARGSIEREVTMRADGVETLTESDDPEVARAIQAHVRSMTARVETGQPIHLRDPLFRALFEHVDRIELRWDATDRGVRVVEISTDPFVVRLIQEHARVVSAFLANGHDEMMRDHSVPERGP